MFTIQQQIQNLESLLFKYDLVGTKARHSEIQSFLSKDPDAGAVEHVDVYRSIISCRWLAYRLGNKICTVNEERGDTPEDNMSKVLKNLPEISGEKVSLMDLDFQNIEDAQFDLAVSFNLNDRKSLIKMEVDRYGVTPMNFLKGLPVIVNAVLKLGDSNYELAFFEDGENYHFAILPQALINELKDKIEREWVALMMHSEKPEDKIMLDDCKSLQSDVFEKIN